MNFAGEPIMYEDFDFLQSDSIIENTSYDSYDVCPNTESSVDVLLYAKRIATYMKYIYLFWFVFLAITVYYDYTRVQITHVDPEIEQKMKALEDRMQESVKKIKKEMKKFKKNMKKVRKTNKEIYKLQQQICDHYHGDDEDSE